MGDEGGGDVTEFAVGVLGNVGEQGEGLTLGAAAFTHQDAFGLLDHRPRGHGLFHLAGQGCGLHAGAGVDHHDRGAPGELPTVLVEGVPGRSRWNSGIIIVLTFDYTLLTL